MLKYERNTQSKFNPIKRFSSKEDNTTIIKSYIITSLKLCSLCLLRADGCVLTHPSYVFVFCVECENSLTPKVFC